MHDIFFNITSKIENLLPWQIIKTKTVNQLDSVDNRVIKRWIKLSNQIKNSNRLKWMISEIIFRNKNKMAFLKLSDKKLNRILPVFILYIIVGASGWVVSDVSFGIIGGFGSFNIRPPHPNDPVGIDLTPTPIPAANLRIHTRRKQKKKWPQKRLYI